MEVICLPEALDAFACARFTARAEAEGFCAMARHYPEGYRNNDRSVVDDPALAAELFSSLASRLPASLVRHGQRYWLRGLNRRFRFCRYQAGQHFSVHRDGAHMGSDGTRSLLTCQLYLNDAAAFSGGRTRFYDSNTSERKCLHAILPRLGAAIVFDHDFWHDGEAVTAGVKYVMRSDVMYAPEQPASELCAAGYVWALAPTGQGMAVGSRDGCVRWFKEERGELGCVDRRKLGDSSVLCLANHAGALAAGTRRGAIVVLTDAAPHSWSAHDGAVLSLLDTANGLVSSGADGRLCFWRGEDCREAKTDAGWMRRLALHERGILSGSDDGGLRLWRGAEVELIARFASPITALASSPLGVVIGTASGRVHWWSAALDGERAAWQLHVGAVPALAWHCRGFASGGEDGAVLFTNSQGSRVCLRHDDFVQALAFAADRLWSGAYDGVRVTRVS